MTLDLQALNDAGVAGAPQVPTRSSEAVDLLAPDWQSIDFEDMAYGLARLPRFLGQTRRVYSVAEHSLLAGRLESRRSKPRVLAALLHDGHEYAMGDITWPVQRALHALTGGRFDGAIGVLKHGLDRAIARAVLEAYGPGSLEDPSELVTAGAVSLEQQADWLASDMHWTATAVDPEALQLEWAALIWPGEFSKFIPEAAPDPDALAEAWLDAVRDAASGWRGLTWS